MRLGYLRPSQGGWLGISKWSWRAAVTAMALVASMSVMGSGTVGAVPVPHTQTEHSKSTTVLNPPAHQMAALNFLLGEYKCLTTPAPGLGRVTIYETTHKILDGNYYQMLVKIPVPGGTVAGYWTLGWDPVDQNYIAQYFDNRDTTGTDTSAGWQDGHLKFSGPYVRVVTTGGVSGVAKGGQTTSQDDFVIVQPGHYIDYGSRTVNGQWISTGYADCHQIS